MRFTCEYPTLVNNLTDISNVIEDSMSSDELKNIIFMFTRDSDGNGNAVMIGVNQLITFRRTIEYDKYSLELTDEELADGAYYLQLKNKELLDFLNSYKTVRKTTVKEVSFELTDRNLIRCKVLETDNQTEQPYISSWTFNNVVLKPNVKAIISYVAPAPESLVEIESVTLLFHTRNLLPIMTNVSSLYGQMLMGDDFVVAFNSAYVTLMKNATDSKGVFEGVKLSYRAIAFIDKIICAEDYVSVAKMEQHIYFKTSNSEAFIVYDTKMAEYRNYVEAFKRDHAITLDRVMLKDILKRLSLTKDSVEITIKSADSVVSLANTKYTQEIPLIQNKAMDEFGTVGFKIMPDVLNKAIIGADEEFSGELYVYYCPQQQQGNAVIVFSDSSGAWFSVVKVKTFRRDNL